MTAVGSGTDDDLLRRLRALGEPHRLALLRALRERERCVRELVDTVGLSQSLVSHHLAKLAEAGLVRSRQADGFTHYSLDPDGVSLLSAQLALLLDVADLPAQARPGGNVSCCRAGATTTVDMNGGR